MGLSGILVGISQITIKETTHVSSRTQHVDGTVYLINVVITILKLKITSIDKDNDNTQIQIIHISDCLSVSLVSLHAIHIPSIIDISLFFYICLYAIWNMG